MTDATRTENATRMDAELKAKWVAALRSGKYKQATGTLNDCGGGYCCLGVLLDISGRGLWRSSSYEFEADDGESLYCDGDLGRRVRILMRINPDQEEKLVGMNDGEPEEGVKPIPFEEIALWIEQNL